MGFGKRPDSTIQLNGAWMNSLHMYAEKNAHNVSSQSATIAYYLSLFN